MEPELFEGLVEPLEVEAAVDAAVVAPCELEVVVAALEPLLVPLPPELQPTMPRMPDNIPTTRTRFRTAPPDEKSLETC
jgi:hypothetical protein